MIIIKNKSNLAKMRHAGLLLAKVMDFVAGEIKPGVTTLRLDALIEQRMRELGLVPECIGYAGYKHASCISVNDVVVHGVPSDKVILKDGDFVKIDIVASYKNYCADMARSFFVGTPTEVAQAMARTAQEALDQAIKIIKPGIYLSDVSSKIQSVVERAGFGVVRDFAGHGIGKSMHEPPEIPNYGKPGQGPVLREGMTLAIEPMITECDYAVEVLTDGWTARTKDGGLAAHVEDTVAVVADGAHVFTRLSQ